MKVTTEIVTEYLEKFGHLPSLTLARLIYKENPEVWNSLDSVRGAIRYHRGSMGKSNNERLSDRRFIREFKKEYLNAFGFPDSDETEFEPYKIEGINKLLVLNDIHVPYHSISALNVMAEYTHNMGIDGILLNGDTIDFHMVSRFCKDPRKRDIVEELNCAKNLLESLENIFNCPIYFKYGNHDERLEMYLKNKAPELYGIPDFELYNLLKFKENGIKWIKDKRTIHFGKLNILHGHELKSGFIAPVNVARGVYLRTKVSTLVGHWHIKTGHGENTLNEKYIECWSVGCMCELHPEWMPNNRWVHGFAIVEKTDDEGGFNVENYKIIKNKVFG